MYEPRPLVARGMLQQILETPHLAALVPTLRPEVLQRVIHTCGLEECGELLQLATADQIRQLADLDLWRPAQPGGVETFDADRFLAWLDVLVDMLAELRRGGVDARLLLVGDSDNPLGRAMIEQRAGELGVAPHVAITGFLPQPEALAQIARADVCISPIYRSPLLDVGSPTKMIEYMALGLPVVANDHPEQRAILRESRAGVCVPWAPRHFARGVRWLMSRDAAERAAMGVRGRAWVENNRTYARIADEVERTCLDVIARRLENPGARAARSLLAEAR